VPIQSLTDHYRALRAISWKTPTSKWDPVRPTWCL